MSNKILIVEDEFIEAMSFEQSLNSLGYDVIGIASTGEDALKKVVDNGVGFPVDLDFRHIESSLGPN